MVKETRNCFMVAPILWNILEEALFHSSSGLPTRNQSITSGRLCRERYHSDRLVWELVRSPIFFAIL